MGKGKGFDVVADAHELSQHNINPHYWINKVTSYTYARWMAEKKIAILFAPFLLVTLALIVWQLLTSRTPADWLYIIPGLLVIAFVTFAYVVMALQWFTARQRESPEPNRPQEKRKKQPKRPKDYH